MRQMSDILQIQLCQAGDNGNCENVDDETCTGMYVKHAAQHKCSTIAPTGHCCFTWFIFLYSHWTIPVPSSYFRSLSKQPETTLC